MQLRLLKTAGGSWLSLVITLATALMHSACCLLPILAVVFPASVLPRFLPDSFGRWIVVFQYIALAYLLVRVLLNRLDIRRFHNPVEHAGFIVAIFIVVGGLAFGHRKSEVQKLTEARLELVRQHRQVSFTLVEGRHHDQLHHDLTRLDGVLGASISIRGAVVRFTYKRSKITEAQIFSYLTKMGYQLRLTEELSD